MSHRALLAAVCCDQPVHISNLNPGRDVDATRNALVTLGVPIEHAGGAALVHPGRLTCPALTLECMNSGSTARMLLGACAGAGISAGFDGDESLRGRPMEPVAAQLRAFGAHIETTDGHLPLQLLGRPQVETRHFILLSPSAQVKSALLFAGLFAGVAIRVDGDRGSRDHTERLLNYLGAPVEWSRTSVQLGTASLRSAPIEVAGDFSSAAFLVTAATITPESSILIRDVGVNPTRTGLLEALTAMGASIERRNERTRCGEPVADLAITHRPLRATAIDRELALRAIDEIPLLAVAAAFAEGTTTISGVEPLRSKESDRIAAIERLLDAVGIGVVAKGPGIAITGGRPQARPSPIDTRGDHRTVMAAAVLACAAGPLAVDDDASAAVSFPGFTEALESLRAG
jgi:3-phosphoshikimate 1-carboxyvinyltransferase